MTRSINISWEFSVGVLFEILLIKTKMSFIKKSITFHTSIYIFFIVLTYSIVFYVRGVSKMGRGVDEFLENSRNQQAKKIK